MAARSSRHTTATGISVDTIEIGATLGVLMEAGQAEFGDLAFMQQALDDIRAGNQRGRLLAQGTAIIPIPGTKSRAHLEEHLAATEIELGPDDLARLDASFPADAAAGTRYPKVGMERVNQ